MSVMEPSLLVVALLVSSICATSRRPDYSLLLACDTIRGQTKLFALIATFAVLCPSAVYSQLNLEKEKSATPSDIALRLERYGGGWILHSTDREKLSFAITNWDDVAITNLHSYRVSPSGLTVQPSSNDKDIFLSWEKLPITTCQKYQQVVAEAQRGNPIPQPPALAPVATPPTTPAYNPVQPSDSYVSPSTPSGGSGGTVHVRGYTRKDGTYVQPHTRSAPRGR